MGHKIATMTNGFGKGAIRDGRELTGMRGKEGVVGERIPNIL